MRKKGGMKLQTKCNALKASCTSSHVPLQKCTENKALVDTRLLPHESLWAYDLFVWLAITWNHNVTRQNSKSITVLSQKDWVMASCNLHEQSDEVQTCGFWYLWVNTLPPELRMSNCTVSTFASKLKTFLFSAVSAPENFWSRAI